MFSEPVILAPAIRLPRAFIAKWPRVLVGLAITCALVLFPLGGLAHGAETVLGENYVIAAYLFNFSKFVDWPETVFSDPDDDIVLAVTDDDFFGDALSAINGKIVKDRQFVVKNLREGTNPLDCQILFIGLSEKRRIPQILAAVDGKPVLTVSNLEGFAEAGGAIELAKKDNRIRLVINLTTIKRTGLKMRSQLLEIATIVY